MVFLKDFLEKFNFDFFFTNFRLVLFVCKSLYLNFVFSLISLFVVLLTSVQLINSLHAE